MYNGSYPRYCNKCGRKYGPTLFPKHMNRCKNCAENIKKISWAKERLRRKKAVNPLDREPVRTCEACGFLGSHSHFHKKEPYCLRCSHRLLDVQKKYGLSKEVFLAVKAAQEGKCKICNEKASLVVDHDHSTGAVRGLICGFCNVMLGLARDDTEVLREAARYLEKGIDMRTCDITMPPTRREDGDNP